MCLVCFLGVSKMKLPCVHSWESCTTSHDCYLAITLVLHRYTRSFTTVHFHLSELLMLLGKQKIWIHTHRLPLLYLHCVSILYHLHCAWCRYFASILLSHVETVFVSKNLFLSSILKGTEQPKELLQKENQFGS